MYELCTANVDVGLDGKSTSIEAFVDVENGRMTIIDNGEGISPVIFEKVLNSSGIAPSIYAYS